jgi:hypothetical protein
MSLTLRRAVVRVPGLILEEARRAVSKERPGPHHEGPVSKGLGSLLKPLPAFSPR